MNSCAKGNLVAVRYYLSKGADVNTLDQERTSLLHIACNTGDFQLVEELINCGANLSIADNAGWTALHVASFFGHADICHLLMKHDANPTHKTRLNETAWDLAKGPMTQQIFDVHYQKRRNERPNRNRSQGDRRPSAREIRTDFNLRRSCQVSQPLQEMLEKVHSPKKHKFYLKYKNLMKDQSFSGLKGRDNDLDNTFTTVCYSPKIKMGNFLNNSKDGGGGGDSRIGSIFSYNPSVSRLTPSKMFSVPLSNADRYSSEEDN